jgi:hypothetical protein
LDVLNESGDIRPIHTWDGPGMEDARTDPGPLEWRFVMKKPYSSIIEENRSTIIHLRQISIFYGELGLGTQKIKDGTITNMDLARTIFPLVLFNKLAGLRRDLGLGWLIIESTSRQVVQNIERARLGCAIFNPKWGDGANDAVRTEMDTIMKSDVETLFPVGKGCIICLQATHLTNDCAEMQSEIFILNRPLPGMMPKHTCHELIAMALSEEDGRNRELPRDTIHKWIELYYAKKLLGKTIDETLAEGFDQVNNDIWKKRPFDTSNAREVRPLVQQESSKPSQADIYLEDQVQPEKLTKCTLK